MQHTLVALVEDKPGVLNRVASLFRRRAFNIESLTVGHTDQPGVSRMTIVIDSNQTRRRARDRQPVQAGQRDPGGRPGRQHPTVSRDLALIKVTRTARPPQPRSCSWWTFSAPGSWM